MGILYQSDCAELVFLAKDALIRARINAQEAQIEEEFDVLYGSGYEPNELGPKLRAEAEKERKRARDYLVEAEQINGQLYSHGEPIVPLRSSLNGQNFRSWGAHIALYHGNSLFAGVDPG